MTKKISISEKEVKQMIKEEYTRKMTELQLTKKLRQINEEIESLESDDLDEVTTGEEVDTTNADGLSKDGKKWNPEFKIKKGNTIIETEEVEPELDLDDILVKLAVALNDKIDKAVDAKVTELEIDLDDSETPEEETEETPEEETEETPEETEEVPEEKEEIDENKLISESAMNRMQILSGIKKNNFHDKF